MRGLVGLGGTGGGEEGEGGGTVGSTHLSHHMCSASGDLAESFITGSGR